jgi:general nucleoside transport system permease protein
MNLWSVITTIGFAASVVSISIPYVLAAVSGTLTERSGTIDLALEAKLLWGAFAAASASHATGSVTVGLIAAAVAGVAVAAIQALCVVLVRGNQVVVGIGLNMIALAGTRFLLQIFYGQGANSPPCPDVGDAVMGNPVFYIAVIASVGAAFALQKTTWGLRVRAAGDRPAMLTHAGVSTIRVRVVAIIVAGAIAGIGGAQLSLSVGGFGADMSGNRGYLALAPVILSSWRPGRAALICIMIALAEALNVQLQISGSVIPRELAPSLPYIFMLIFVVVAGRDRKVPAALGK